MVVKYHKNRNNNNSLILIFDINKLSAGTHVRVGTQILNILKYYLQVQVCSRVPLFLRISSVAIGRRYMVS